MLKKVTILALLMTSVAVATPANFYKTNDGETLKKGQLEFSGGIDYKNAKTPVEDKMEGIGDSEVGYAKANTLSVNVEFNYGLADYFNLKVAAPFVSYNQIGWNGEEGKKGEYVKYKRMGLGTVTVGGKYNLEGVIKTLPDYLDMAIYADLLLGIFGKNIISTGNVDFDLGFGMNYKNFAANLGFRFNSGAFYKENDQLYANANYRLLSHAHQEALGSVNMAKNDINNDKYGGELEDDGKKLPILSLIPYINLAYLADVNKNLGVFAELNLAFPVRSEILFGANIAPSDMREMFIKPFIGFGLTKHSDQLIVGAELVLREGIFSKDKTESRNLAYYDEYTGAPSAKTVVAETAKTVTTPSASTASTPAPVRVIEVFMIVANSEFTNVRAAAQSNGRIIATVKKGDQFQYVSEMGQYYGVKLGDGSTGYIHKNVSTKIKTTRVMDPAEAERERIKEEQQKQMLLEQQRKQQLEQQRLIEEQKRAEQQRLAEQKKLEEQRLLEQKRLAEQQKLEAEKQRKLQKENNEWKKYEVTNKGKVNKAAKKVAEGVTGATYALAKALSYDDDGTRNASYDALVKAGAVSVPAVAEQLKADRYFTKKQAVLVLKEIGHASAVPYLAAALNDKSISKEAEDALKAIPGAESSSALLNHVKQQEMANQIDMIKQQQENQDRALFARHGLNYGDTKNNILIIAQKIGGFKKNPSTEPQAVATYNEQFIIFEKLIKKYDGALGAGATLGLLEGYGYDKTIMTK